jgi:TrmH RNA methyltransferase
MKHRPNPPRAHTGPGPSRGPTHQKAPPSPRRTDETIVGLRAGLAVFAKRPDDILRVGYGKSARTEVEALIRWASAHRVPCGELSDAELTRIADSEPHEGLCVLAKERRWAGAQEIGDLLVQRGGTAIALDRVRNPYNIGAILRSAAFFGVDAALLGTPAPHPGLPPTAVRVAEGGTEHVTVARTTDLADTLGRLRAKKVRVVGADGGADRSALEYPFVRPTILVLGNEREGLGDRVRAQCDAIVAIPGSGAVESLNVAVAAGVLIAELSRRRATSSNSQ